MRLKWNRIPGEAGFAYATHKGVRVGHVVRDRVGGDWTAIADRPTLSFMTTRPTEAAARAAVRDHLVTREAQTAP